MSNLWEPHTPTDLAHIIKTQRSSVSRAILELEEKKLVKCITPDEKMGRFYEITELGKKVSEKVAPKGK